MPCGLCYNAPSLPDDQPIASVMSQVSSQFLGDGNAMDHNASTKPTAVAVRHRSKPPQSHFPPIMSSTTTSGLIATSLVDPAKPFVCSWLGCTKAYTRASTLRSHEDAEHKLIKLICFECGQEFRRKNELTQHQKRKHQGLRPYVCHTDGSIPSGCGCGRAFATSSDMYRHQRTMLNRLHRGHQGRPGRRIPLACSQAVEIPRAPPQQGPEHDLERTIVALRSYVIGSVEQGKWIPTAQDDFCVNTPLGWTTLQIIPRLDTVAQTLVDHEYQEAGVQMSLICQEASLAIQLGVPHIFSDLLLWYLSFCNSGHLSGLLERSYKTIVQFVYGIYKKVHTQTHPLTQITRMMAKPIGHTLPSENASLLLEAIGYTLEEALGPNFESIALQAAVLSTRENAISHLGQLTVQCSKKLGRWHLWTRTCFGKMLRVLWTIGDDDRLQQELDNAERGLRRETKPEERVPWMYLVSRWRCRMAVYVNADWEAAALLSDEMVQVATMLWGEDDAAIDRWMLRREEALRKSHQLGRLQEAKRARIARTQRLIAEAAERENLEYSRWRNSKSEHEHQQSLQDGGEDVVMTGV